MNYARKKRKTVTAYELGARSPKEEQLIREGTIRCLPDGRYALFSQEAVNGTGETAQPGDFFKVDVIGGRNYPYPNSRSYFEANHRHIQGDQYEQLEKTVAVWQNGDGPCEELEFLLRTGRLTLNPEDSERYFNAVLFGAPLSAPRDAAVVFYRVDRDSRGRITDIEFNFVAHREFARDYILTARP